MNAGAVDKVLRAKDKPSPAQGYHTMQAWNDNATISRSIYPITQNIFQEYITNNQILQERARDEPTPDSGATPATR